MKGNREQGTGNREQGTGNREQETGNREQGTGNRKQKQRRGVPLWSPSSGMVALFRQVVSWLNVSRRLLTVSVLVQRQIQTQNVDSRLAKNTQKGSGDRVVDETGELVWGNLTGLGDTRDLRECHVRGNMGV